VATRPALDPSCPAVIRVYDTSKQYGVHLALVDMPGASELTYSGGDNPTLRPHVCSIRKDECACILDVDSSLCTVLGWRPEDVIGKPTLELIDPKDHDKRQGEGRPVVRGLAPVGALALPRASDEATPSSRTGSSGPTPPSCSCRMDGSRDVGQRQTVHVQRR